MKVVVVGSGGREHALIQAIKKSKRTSGLWAWPGNDGILQDAERVPVAKQNYPEFCRWCTLKEIDLVVIGPELDLVAGLSDELRAAGIKVFGPDQKAAQLEGSKIFSKEFIVEHAIPTARADVVRSVEETLTAATRYSAPYVLKADGLAAGKGVFICADLQELAQSAKDIFEKKILGAAGEQALLEEFQPGEELSVLILTNGENYQWLPICRDHKRLQDGDRGPNTGGMGVVGPVSIPTALRDAIESRIVRPSIEGIEKSGYLYRGVLFIGIMVTEKGPQVLEYNTRFGDPETQVIMQLLDGEWLDVFAAVADGQMPQLQWRDEKVACVVLAAEGYPDQPKLGVPIHFTDTAPSPVRQILHAGTRFENNHFVTNGGRVLNIIARGETMSGALAEVYKFIGTVKWPGMQYRHDIGASVK